MIFSNCFNFRQCFHNHFLVLIIVQIIFYNHSNSVCSIFSNHFPNYSKSDVQIWVVPIGELYLNPVLMTTCIYFIYFTSISRSPLGDNIRIGIMTSDVYVWSKLSNVLLLCRSAIICKSVSIVNNCVFYLPHHAY